MHELLVGYLLNEIDDEQRRLVEEQLELDPQLRRQLEQLRHCLGDACSDHARGDELEAAEPPTDLAQRTSETVAHVAESGEYDQADCLSFSSLGFSQANDTSEQTASSSSWTVADMTVAAGVVLAVGMLLLPALRDSRVASRRVACQNNMKEVGFTLANYSETYNRTMPVIKRGENAGMYTVRLVSRDFIDRSRLARLVVCPSSKLADDVRQKRVIVRIPTLMEYQRASQPVRVQLCRTMGGSFAYRLPYRQGNRYQMVRNAYRSNVPVLSDAPREGCSKYTSSNHGGCGENVLFQDLSVRYLVGCLACPKSRDHLFLNDEGLPRPSTCPKDTVLARSDSILKE